MLCFLKYWKSSVQVTLKGIYLKSHTKGFIHRLQSCQWKHTTKNTEYHVKVLLKRFQLNGHSKHCRIVGTDSKVLEKSL